MPFRNTCLIAAAAISLAALVLAGFSPGAGAQQQGESAAETGATKTAIFAGGCFWCVESDFDRVPGVIGTVSGYTGGTVADPTYEQVTRGGTGHREAVRIEYDPSRVGYEELLSIFWRTVDPTDDGGQFCDRGQSYETAIFVENEEQRQLAEQSKAEAAEAIDGEIVTPIEDAGPFYVAEDYHQEYYIKAPMKYKYYRWACGRDERIKEIWGDEAFKGLEGYS